MSIGYINVAKDVTYDTEGTQTGLTDLKFAFFDPAGVNDPLNDVTMTEVGNTGVYKGAFTPTSLGTWVVVVSSATSSPVIENKAGVVEVRNYTETQALGAGFVSATDSQEAIANALAAIAAQVQAPSARGSVLV